MNKNAFTLIELMTVVVIIGLVAGFSIPQFNAVIEKAHRKSGEANLRMIHEANKAYWIKNEEFWPLVAGQNVAAINANLKTYITEEGLTYSCSGNGSTYSCTAVRSGEFTLTVTEAPLDGANPSCAGTCP